jgi:hypothetical protein
MGALFGALSKLRGARVFHPDGVGYSGVLRVERSTPSLAGAPLLGEPGEHPAVFRFSRGAGLPEPLPDVLGLAVRLTDAHGPNRHQDFLLVTSADAPVLHHLLLPSTGFFGQSFSSLLLYRIGGNVRLVGAQPVRGPSAAGPRGAIPQLEAAIARGEAGFTLALASLTGRWESLGRLEVGTRLGDAETEALAFNPWNSGGGIRPVGPLMGLRRGAYPGSQRGRFSSRGGDPRPRAAAERGGRTRTRRRPSTRAAASTRGSSPRARR